jgi:uncharacterized protein YqhQ
MTTEKRRDYGGQAVIEGVMFGGETHHVTAVRRKDQTIEYFELPKQDKTWLKPLRKIPFIRGIIGLIEASANGSKHLNFSAERFDVDPSEDEQVKIQEQSKSDISSKLAMIFGVAVIGVLSLIFGKLIFTVVPAVLADQLFPFITNNILQNLIEGGIKIILLVGYILLIAQTPYIKRLFQYHGAEHKVINAYEAGVDLTVANVQRFSTLHYRCGSSFIILTVLIGVILYSFFHYDNLWERIYQRVLLIPVVVGLSYEVLRLTNSVRDTPVLTYLGYPGLWLQKLTTKQPDDKQVEVAIAAFERMRALDQQARTAASTEPTLAGQTG